MDTTVTPAEPAVPTSSPGMSVWQRLVAVFTRPAHAWTGLDRQVQWWFPMLVMALFAAGFALALHQRALVPMMTETWQQQVANGAMQAEQMEKMESFFAGPMGMTFGAVQQFLIIPIVTLLVALIIWFGLAFILGRSMKYRLALELAAWASLITLPAQILTGIVAWTRETMKGVHVGFGMLLPDTETPSRVGVFLGAVLDALGPLSIWYVVVLVLGGAALSGAPRRQAAWVLGGLYLALTLLLSTLGAMFAPVPAS